jgi:hypothetical protein
MTLSMIGKKSGKEITLSDIQPGELYTQVEARAALRMKSHAQFKCACKAAGIVSVKIGGVSHPRIWGRQILELAGRKIIETPPETESASERRKRADAAMNRIAASKQPAAAKQSAANKQFQVSAKADCGAIECQATAERNLGQQDDYSECDPDPLSEEVAPVPSPYDPDRQYRAVRHVGCRRIRKPILDD